MSAHRPLIAGIRWLLVSLALFAALSAATAQAKVYAIMVMDTGAEDWTGDYCKNDLEALTTALHKITAPKDLKILPQPRTWNDTLQTIADCPAGPDDAIALFFSGHGGYNAVDGHFLALASPGAKICTRTAIRKALEAKKVRLAAILSNCCFNYIKPVPRQIVVGAPPPLEESSPLFTSLFLKAKGFVDITACQRDRPAVGNSKVSRSIFINSLARLLERRQDDALDWDKFFLALREEAANEFKDLFPNGSKNPDGTILPDQIALAFRLPGDTALDRAGIRFGVKAFGTNGRGVRIGEIYKGFPGELSGLQIGDVIIEINNRRIAYEQDYDKAVDASDQDMQIKILRNGRPQELGVRLRY
jgi:hypothetical protein